MSEVPLHRTLQRWSRTPTTIFVVGYWWSPLPTEQATPRKCAGVLPGIRILKVGFTVVCANSRVFLSMWVLHVLRWSLLAPITRVALHGHGLDRAMHSEFTLVACRPRNLCLCRALINVHTRLRVQLATIPFGGLGLWARLTV